MTVVLSGHTPPPGQNVKRMVMGVKEVPLVRLYIFVPLEVFMKNPT